MARVAARRAVEPLRRLDAEDDGLDAAPDGGRDDAAAGAAPDARDDDAARFAVEPLRALRCDDEAEATGAGAGAGERAPGTSIVRAGASGT